MEGRRGRRGLDNSQRRSWHRVNNYGINNASQLKSRTATSSTQQLEEESGNDLSSIPSVVGTCLFMCPEYERMQRERLRDLAVFERLNGNPSKTTSELAVKKFCRTISTKETSPAHIRPLAVLEETLSYLLNLMESTDHPFETVHDFVSDRTRSIRQDLSIQNIVNDKAITIVEKVVEFHVQSMHKMQRAAKSSDLSSLHLNMEQLMKSLASLYSLYDATRGTSFHPREPEFISLHLLLRLDSKSQPMGEPLSIWFRSLPNGVIHSKELSFARKALRFFKLGYFKQFLNVVSSDASYLQVCVLGSAILQVRVEWLCCLNNVGYKVHPYELKHLAKLMMMKQVDLEDLCDSCGLRIKSDEFGNRLLETKQDSFVNPKGIPEKKFSNLEQ